MTIKKVIIPVAGLGTRFLPATKAQPKEMLPIVDKPIIQYLVEEAVSAGINQVIFVTGRGKRAIEDHFDYSYELEQNLASKGKKELLKNIKQISDIASFTYVRQKEPKGDGDAILAAAHLIDDEPVAVLFGDDIIDGVPSCLKQMVDAFESLQNPLIALDVVPKSKVSQYGIVSAEKINERICKIKSLVEKPKVNEAPSNLAVVGKYIITKEVFATLKRLAPKTNGELRLADAFKELASKQDIYGFKFSGKRYDCGSKIGYLKAIVDFGLKHKETKIEFKKYLKEIKL